MFEMLVRYLCAVQYVEDMEIQISLVGGGESRLGDARFAVISHGTSWDHKSSECKQRREV